MIRRGKLGDAMEPHDHELHLLLKENDPVAPPSAGELAALEIRIMARIDTQPDSSIAADFYMSPETFSKNWALRAAVAGLLFIVLGFVVGRNFDELAFQPADPAALFASADETPWQSFIAAPSSGESDDDTE